MKIILIGMPGSGKTTTAKIFAEHKKIEYIDSDMYIEKKYRMSINQIFKKLGENKFREYEHNVLTELFEKDNFILAAGGGLPCFFDNMNLVKEKAVSVYLSMSAKMLVDRILQVGKGRERPLIKGKSESEVLQYIQETLNDRRKFYEQADYKIDAAMSIEDILRCEPFELRLCE